MRACLMLFTTLAGALLAACSVKPATFTAQPEDCSTTGDEDGNGQADCDDPACASAPACQPRCGNGKRELPEECDDGNPVNGDACDTNCTLPRCGNAITAPGEQCDDGASNGLGQRCNATCGLNVCGDGDKRIGVEECDDGNLIDGDACDTNCTLPRCGNAITDPLEQCDDGATNGPGRRCNATCRLNVCGDGDKRIGVEECDDGAATASCDLDCTLPRCNDGQFNPAAGEERDPPVSPSSVVPVSSMTCRFDFSAINQLFCAGTCGTWGGGNGCQQADADAFCKLRTGNPNSTAISFTVGVATGSPGICCPSVDPSVTRCTSLGVFNDRGVPQLVSVDEISLLSSHGPGQIITNPVCTNP